MKTINATRKTINRRTASSVYKMVETRRQAEAFADLVADGFVTVLDMTLRANDAFDAIAIERLTARGFSAFRVI